MPERDLKQPLRVLQVTGSLAVGGAEMIAVTVAEQLEGLCQIHFLVFGDAEGALEERVLAAGAAIHRLPAPGEFGPRRFIARVAALMAAEKYDAVHSHINLASGMIMMAAAKAAVPIRVAHSHSVGQGETSWPRRAYSSISKGLIRRYSTVYAACGEEAGKGLFGAAWQSGKSVLLHNAVNVDQFLHARNGRHEVRAELGIDLDRTVVGMVARLMLVKNHDFMLDVVALDAEERGDVVLLIIGDGPLRSEIEGRAAALGIEDRLQFLGTRSDVPRLLGAMDVLAMPSHFEGLPVSLVEAQAAGLRCLVSENVTTESDFALGLVTHLPITSPESWQKALAIPPAQPPSPSDVQRALEDRGYDIRVVADRWLDLYGREVSPA